MSRAREIGNVILPQGVDQFALHDLLDNLGPNHHFAIDLDSFVHGCGHAYPGDTAPLAAVDATDAVLLAALEHTAAVLAATRAKKPPDPAPDASDALGDADVAAIAPCFTCTSSPGDAGGVGGGDATGSSAGAGAGAGGRARAEVVEWLCAE